MIVKEKECEEKCAMDVYNVYYLSFLFNFILEQNKGLCRK
jgi:hypothetical protein